MAVLGMICLNGTFEVFAVCNRMLADFVLSSDMKKGDTS